MKGLAGVAVPEPLARFDVIGTQAAWIGLELQVTLQVPFGTLVVELFGFVGGQRAIRVQKHVLVHDDRWCELGLTLHRDGFR